MTKLLSLSFKNRIAFNYFFSGSLLIVLVFFIIYSVLKYNVDEHINEEISVELNYHLSNVEIINNQIISTDLYDWQAVENNSILVEPIFVQFYDFERNTIDKSPNLKVNNLKLLENSFNNTFFNTEINGVAIRQFQTEIKNNDATVGYLIVATYLEDEKLVNILKNILILSFPIIVLFLFIVARFFAGRSIKPVEVIINTSSQITKNNLQARIPLPQNKDELYTLSKNINSLLDRIENAIEREKQFTSDASHELRTPLAVIKGTLEVLVRKPREKQEYEEKINFCIKEVDRINNLVDNLLLLARFENEKQNIKSESMLLNALLLDTAARFSQQIKEKNIQIKSIFLEDFYINSDYSLVSIIISNLFSNALKYSNNNTSIVLKLFTEKGKIKCGISDNGFGILAEDKDKIFNAFFRSNSLEHSDVKGTGLGLSIVKRLCELLNVTISIDTKITKGTTIILTFP
jgi:signal transduction histidine kinase